MASVVEYYTGYDEEGRLGRHRAEFVATTYLLSKWIEPQSRILDVGAGTGAYSLHLASRGHDVTAVDIVPKHVRSIQSKAEQAGNLKLSVLLGDARDLAQFRNAQFDVVLCMGPIYHLDGEDVHRAIGECVGALRDGGILCAAYVNKYDGYGSDRYREFFKFRSSVEFVDLLADHPVEPLCHAPVDGPAFAQLDEGSLHSEGDLAGAHVWLEENSQVLEPTGLAECVHGLWIGRKMDLR